MTNCNTNSKRGSLSPAPRSRSRSVRRRGRSMIRKEHHEDRQLTPAPFKFGASSTSAVGDARVPLRRPVAPTSTTTNSGMAATTAQAIVRAKSVEEESAADLAASSSSHCRVYLPLPEDENEGDGRGVPPSSSTRGASLGHRFSHPQL